MTDTFTCVWCEKKAPFPGAVVGTGHACSSSCYAHARDAYWRNQEPARYGRPSRVERTWYARHYGQSERR